MYANEFTISPLGDSALIIDFANVIDEGINKKVSGIFHKLKALSLPCIRDIVPAYSSLVVHFDVFAITRKTLINKTAFEIVSEQLKQMIKDYAETALPRSRFIKIPVCYSEKYAPDIIEIAEKKKIAVAEIIRLHTEKKYRVYMIGFLPGFAYMGETDEKISMPRKAEPRLRVEAGSVGIAGMQTGIYPLDSPGGWQIIGKTPVILFNKEKDEPVLLQPGDEIEFYSITESEFTNY
ncbi:MAG: 5-oxoprolinase subunit PxpB [Ginsengibacter sp.]